MTAVSSSSSHQAAAAAAPYESTHASSTPAASSKRSTLRPRVPRLALEGVSRHWFAGSLAATHVANGVNLLFPAGERFFIRSVRHYMDRITPDLAAQVKGFFGQEGRHAQAHERLFDTLRAQGFDIDSILERYEYLAYKHIEKKSPHKLRLSVTVALEHFTAILAEDALSTNGLAHADPEMRRLLEWHAVEELEHKAVAFDVMKQVAPSYLLRVIGMILATTTLVGFWIWATRRLLKQDGSTLRAAGKELRSLRKAAESAGEMNVMQPVFTRVFLRGIREYLRPGFHPMDRDHSQLIASSLARLRAEGVVSDDNIGAASASDEVPS